MFSTKIELLLIAASFVGGILANAGVRKFLAKEKQDITNSIADFLNKAKSVDEDTKTKLLGELRAKI